MFRKLMKSSDRISIKFPQFLFLILYQIFPAKRSKRDANYFRRCEASKTQIISGEAKQARRKLFLTKRARRKSFPAKRSKRDANHFWRSKTSKTQIISTDFLKLEAQHAQLISIQFRPAAWYFCNIDRAVTRAVGKLTRNTLCFSSYSRLGIIKGNKNTLCFQDDFRQSSPSAFWKFNRRLSLSEISSKYLRPD